MKIVLDRARCEGHGLCEEAAPQLMHLDDDGELVLDREEIDGGRPAARERRCPRVPGRCAPDRMSASVIRRIVVVGNGIAGLTAADTMRDAGFDGELTIVGDERHPPYSRPALSKALLSGGADASAHGLPAPTHGARELLGVRASGLDPERRRVTLDDATELPYDRLVVATGSRARRLSDLPGELTLRGLDDAIALRDRLAARPSVVVVGGGPLGMEIASACLAAGCRVTLVSLGTPLEGQLGPLPRRDLRRRRACPRPLPRRDPVGAPRRSRRCDQGRARRGRRPRG